MMSNLVQARRRIWLYICVGVILLFLILPIFVVIPVSFSDSKYLEFPPRAYSLKWYEAYLDSSEWLSSTRVSLMAAVLTALVVTPIGTATAYYLNNLSPRMAQLVSLVVVLPAIVPNILLAIGLFYVYIRLNLVNTMLGIVLAHTLLALPFVVVTVLSALRAFDNRQELVARSLGAPRFSAFMRVTLPQIKASLISGGLFAFIISLDEVVLGLFVAGGENMVITRRMFTALRDSIDPTVAAISTIFIAVSLLTLTLGAIFGKRGGT